MEHSSNMVYDNLLFSKRFEKQKIILCTYTYASKILNSNIL